MKFGHGTVLKRMYFYKYKSRIYCNLFTFFIACACLFTLVSCDGALCNEPPEILNAHADLQGLRPPFPNGTNITYKCVDGFAVTPGANLHVICVANNETTSWIHDDENFQCARVCGDLPEIPHATLELEGISPPYGLGVRIRVSCDRGYITGGTSPHIQCAERDGVSVWDVPERACKPRSCGSPGEVENGQRIGSVFTFPNSVTYECYEGFKMRGVATIYCYAAGSWSRNPPTCEAIICPLLPELENGHVISRDRKYNSVATYGCNKGFKLNGPGERICRADSQWSDNSPSCDAVHCDPPGELENGRVVTSKEIYDVNDFVIFVCNTGGVTRTSKCQEDGSWSFRPPHCPGTPGTSSTAIGITIPPPTKTPTSSPGNRNGTTETAAVVDTIAPAGGGTTENINASMCDDPGDITHGTRTVSGLIPGGNVTYICEDGYDLRGKRTLVCLGTGKWDLDKLPICVKTIPVPVIVGIVFGLIALALSFGGLVYYFIRWKKNNPKGYGKKSKALTLDATDVEEITRLEKEKQPIPVTVL